MTSYVKTEVGNKLFTIEWNFSAGLAEVEGQKFECKDCELVSIFGIAPNSAEARIAFSNHSQPENYRISVPASDVFVSPHSGDLTGPDFPPFSRWIWPILDIGSGDLKLALLFREI